MHSYLTNGGYEAGNQGNEERLGIVLLHPFASRAINPMACVNSLSHPPSDIIVLALGFNFLM